MVWYPSAIYRVVHIDGWRVVELRISDAVIQKARQGHKNYQDKICIAFRKRLEKDTGHDCGWVIYSSLVFIKLRDVPAGDVVASEKRA